jgi:hypothetical protein
MMELEVLKKKHLENNAPRERLQREARNKISIKKGNWSC